MSRRELGRLSRTSERAVRTELRDLLRGEGLHANFVGQWVPTFLLFGVYNKIVKVAGHDRSDRMKLDS